MKTFKESEMLLFIQSSKLISTEIKIFFLAITACGNVKIKEIEGNLFKNMARKGTQEYKFS